MFRRAYYTINEVLKLYKGEFVEVEGYFGDNRTRPELTFHSDFIEWIDGVELLPRDKEIVIDACLMDEEDYHRTVEANSAIETDFEEIYGDKNAEVLVIIIDKERLYDEEE